MAAPVPPDGGGAAPDRRERFKLAMAVAGLAFVTLLAWALYNLLRSALEWLYSLYGILVLIGLGLTAAAFVVALALSGGRRRPPDPADAATAVSVQTREI